MEDILSYQNSMILRSADSQDPQVRIAAAIEMSIDRVYLALYYKRAPHKSVTHIHRLLLKMNADIQRLTSKIWVNPNITSVLNNINILYRNIIESSEVNKVVLDYQLLESLVIPYDQTHNIIRSIKFVLAIADKINYIDSNMVVPYIRITPDNNYIKDLVVINLSFKNEKSQRPTSSEQLWYNIFYGLRLNTSLLGNKENFDKLCATINIGVLPDSWSGIGLTHFYYEAYNASSALQQFVKITGATIIDFELVDTIIRNNNNDTITQNILIKQYPSLEADSTDSVAPGEEEKPEEKPADDTTKTKDDNLSSEPIDETTDESATPDKSASDAPSDEAPVQEDEIPTEDTSASEEETQPQLLGTTLTLTTNDTLDNFLYKITVAKFIDNVIQFNHDELPLETVAMLTQWKSTLLFLTAAEETKKLLTELKIKMK